MPKRIESKTSRTAEFTCTVRCLSYLERIPQYQSGDYVSLIIMNSLIKSLARLRFFQRLLKRSFAPGMYEYVIARTKYIDEAMRTALQDGMEQVLILGAGFDSRGIRFQKISSGAKIFELDAPITQRAKLERYKEKGIDIPANLIFIPVDFDHQRISDRLTECGFEKDKKSLIIMEGLTMYLQPESIDSLLTTLRDYTGKESLIVFDFIYTSVLNHENLYKGEKELVESTAKNGEGFSFGLDKKELPVFLSKYGFTASDISDSGALECRFFADDTGKLLSAVNGTHCIVTANKR